MQNIRAFLYYTLFCASMIVNVCLFWFVLLLPSKYVWFFSRRWIKSSCWLLKITCGVKIKARGQEYITKDSVIYASKHQSVLETLFLGYTLIDPIIVTKKEMHYLPIFGWYMARCGSIAIERSRGIKALQKILKNARRKKAKNKSFLIFPEGTRQEIGAKPNYKSGIYILYKNLNIPVVPIAHNAGLFWKKNTFKKTPGTAIIEFLPHIEPGLSKKDFMERLINSIESKTNTLLEEGRNAIKCAK